jgi:quercetin 2,3-dioxygenase
MTVTEGGRSPLVPVHAHQRTHEAIFCLEGRMRVTVNGDEHLLTRGDFVSLPSGAEHSYALDGHLTRFITIYGPAGPERLHELAGTVAEQRIFPAQAGPVDEDRLAGAAAELDIVIL